MADERIINLTRALALAVDNFTAAETVQQRTAQAKEVELLKSALSAAKMLRDSEDYAEEIQGKILERNRKEAHAIKSDYAWLIMKTASEPVKYFTEYQFYWESQHEGESLDPKGLQLLKIIMVENVLAAATLWDPVIPLRLEIPNTIAANFWKELLEPRLTEVHEKNQKLSWGELKVLFLTYFKSATWKTEENLKFWSVQYKKTETIQEFLERYLNRARSADINLKIDDETVAKALFDLLPPSVTRNTSRDLKKPLKIEEAVRNYRGVPEDAVLPLVYCPCCSEAGKFICVKDNCGFYTASAATIKRQNERRKNEDDGETNPRKFAKTSEEIAERQKKFDQAYKDKKCVDCGAEWQGGHMCAERKARSEKKEHGLSLFKSKRWKIMIICLRL